jgi:hypothetical protein
MAYINKEKVAEIRKNLKAAFPEIKFSVRNENHTSISVKILQSPYEFVQRDTMEHFYGYRDVNHYWFKDHGYNHTDVLDRIIEICNEGNFNDSRPEIDYFHVGWYFNLSIGSWDKPYKLVA